MGFFKNIFGQSDDDEQNEDYYESLDYSDDDDDVDNYYDDDDDNNDSDSSDKYYSIAKVQVVGFDDLEDADKDYIRDRLEEDTHVYLRYDFDCPDKKQALKVYRHSWLLGYIEPSKSEILHTYLHESKIGAVIVSKIKSKDFKISIDLKVYYEDPHGEELMPYYPFEGRQLDVIEVDLWTGQEDWSEDWFMNPFTDELSYKYNNMYDDDVDDDEKNMVNAWFMGWCRSYFDGTCITKKGSEHYVNYLTSDSAKTVLRKRIEAYLENKCLHFADKEQFSDLEIENDSKEEESAPAIAKRYNDTYQIAYIDGQGKRQNKTIKNANFSSFIAGIKYRENWEELISKLSDGMKVHLKKEPDNEFDPSAIAVYNGDDCLGYIPQKDIPAVSWCMNGDELDAEIEYIDEDYVSLVIPATFQNLSNCDDEELEGVRFSKTERTKYEIGAYQEARIGISKEEFLEGIKQQRENL